MAQPAEKRLTYAEYLELEAETGVKHEFLDGEVLAMSGGSADHALIALSFGSELRFGLRGSGCRPFSSDWKVWIPEALRAAYPDVSVFCGDIVRSEEDENAGLNPVLLAEVLSPSTQDHDRGAKARDYLKIPTLRALALIESQRVEIEVWIRNDDDSWTVRTHRAGGAFTLPVGDGVTLSVDRLYEDTELVAPPAE